MTHASVFSGIGGPEVAATMLGWENLFHCEINPFGRKVLDYWYPNAKSYEDITTTDFTEWRGRVDVLTGGFPCQPFSYAGRRRGAEDDRYLWPSMYRAIDEIQPTWVVAENVAGILTMVEQGEVSKVAGAANLFDARDDLRGRYELRETFTLQRICTDLESHGYAVQPVLIPACSVGAPHRRDRVFIVARRVTADTYHGRQSQSEPTRRQGEHETERARMDDSAQRKSENGNFANAATIPQDSMHSRQLHRQDEVEGSERNERHTCAGGGERICGETSRTTSADSDGCGSVSSRQSETSEGNGIDQLSQSDGQGVGCASSGHPRLSGLSRPTSEDVINSERIRRAARSNDDGFSETSQQGERGKLEFGGADCPQNWWRGFPSVSPVHRGNDGLPFDVDRLTLSFGKWRTEALKAYGNAIVPQVMYEIFRAIEIVEQ